MATEKPRLTITMDSALAAQVDTYRARRRLSTQSRALVELVRSGLSAQEAGGQGLLSGEAARLAAEYDTLDAHGAGAVRGLMDAELERLEQARQLTEPALREEEKVIPLYLFPAAAGYPAPVFGSDYEPLTLKRGDPMGAEFAVRIQGSSMEPVIPDGGNVFCNRDPLSDGDVGVFSVDGGEIVCKQYHHDAALGITYLFSLNRACADADVVLTPGSGQNLMCLGRVILHRRFPLPGL